MKKVCILGVGRQGSAAAYDIIKYARPKSILLLDYNSTSIKNCIQKIKKIKSDSTLLQSELIDLNNKEKLSSLLTDVDILLSAVPYQFNPMLTDIAIKTKTSMVDLGGHTENVIKQLKNHDLAINNNISIVPDCGMGPGMNISMALLAMEQLDEPQDVYIWDGGLPKKPIPPWNYSLFFNIKGLTNEYDASAFFLKNGKIDEVLCFEKYEEINFDNIGTLEAVVTSGGLSTMPWTYEGVLNTLENKTLRYSGHWELMKAYRQLGLFNEDKIEFKGATFTAREFYHHLLEPLLNTKDNHDICIMRTEAHGIKDNNNCAFRFDVVEEYDNKTGFMAMEKWTGWHASIVMQKIMDGTIEPGAHPIEQALKGQTFYEEATRRGYMIKRTKIK